MIGRRRWFVAAVLGGLLVLGACGGSDDNKSASTTTVDRAPDDLDRAAEQGRHPRCSPTSSTATTPISTRRCKLLDDPAKYKALYSKFAGGATTGPQLGEHVRDGHDVDAQRDGTAQVKYTLNLNGNPTLTNQLGTAVLGRRPVARGGHDVL